MANGNCLSFMSASEIYSLFGNAIDNAITALLKIDMPERRIVSISVKESLGMVSISFENYFTGSLQFENDLPMTTKKDRAYHGFGIRSIKLLVEKYKGYMTFKTDHEKFNLSILIPIDNPI
jgi:sensor histidine kinase regulating citrate/malate metabolism